MMMPQAPGLKPGECFDPALPVDVLQEQRRKEQIGTRFERCTFDIVFHDLGLQSVPGQPFTQARQKGGIEIGACETIGAKNRRVQKIKHLAGSRSGDCDTTAGGQWRRPYEMGRQFGGGLRLAD